MTFAAPALVLTQIKDRKLLALATTSRTALPELKFAVTLEPPAYPDFGLGNWIAILAPAKTPKKVVMELDAGLTQAMSTITKPLTAFGFEPTRNSTPENSAKNIKLEGEKWRQLVRDANIKIPTDTQLPSSADCTDYRRRFEAQ